MEKHLQDVLAYAMKDYENKSTNEEYSEKEHTALLRASKALERAILALDVVDYDVDPEETELQYYI
jgi:hypothetical protein